jgi:DNA replication protein DnaC
MIDEETLRKMNHMKLYGMRDCFVELQENAQSNELSFSEKVGLMIDREWIERENRRLKRLLRAAKLGTDACLEDVACNSARGLDRGMVRQLGSCDWIRRKQNVIVIGKTGVGKTFLGAALAQAACRSGFRALCMRVPRLLHDLAIARADGSYTNQLVKFAKLDVLVLDDFLIAPLTESERRDLLEILEDRYDKSSTVITSQVPTKKWHEMLADPTIADAICDRVVHNAHLLSVTGPSMRKKKGMLDRDKN